MCKYNFSYQKAKEVKNLLSCETVPTHLKYDDISDNVLQYSENLSQNLHYQPKLDTKENVYESEQLLTTKNFSDKMRIQVRGGRGGDGGISFQTTRKRKRGRCEGGNGGNGGNIIFKCSGMMSGFNMSKKSFKYEFS